MTSCCYKVWEGYQLEERSLSKIDAAGGAVDFGVMVGHSMKYIIVP